VTFDDFARRTAEVYRGTLAFLGVPDDGRSDFDVVNRSKRTRSRLLGRLLLNPPRLLAPIRSLALRTSPLGRLWRALTALNTAPAQRRPLQPAFRRELAAVFRDDVALLSKLVGRDFNGWLVG